MIRVIEYKDGAPNQSLEYVTIVHTETNVHFKPTSHTKATIKVKQNCHPHLPTLVCDSLFNNSSALTGSDGVTDWCS